MAIQTDLPRLDLLRELGPAMPISWKKGESIGSGSFGTVFLGLNNETGELLAVKEVSMVVEGSKGKEAVEQLEREVALLSMLNHPNIVRYVGTLREGASLFIFLEYVPGGSIASLLMRFGPLEEAVIKIYTRQILSGLAYLHAQRTVHRDVKGANLLVEKSGRIKLADFGMAKQMVEQVSFTKSFKGSAFWMAPEVIKQQGHGVAADIWSVGCTVLEMATGKPPWSQCSTQVQAIFKIASSQDLPAIPDTLSPDASEFILLCLQRDPAARPSAEDLLKHPFVALDRDRVVPALAADPAYDFIRMSPSSGGARPGGRHQDPSLLPGSMSPSTITQLADPSRSAHTPAASGTGQAPGPPGGPPGGAAGLVGGAELADNLAALVLGSSLNITKHRGAAAAQTAEEAAATARGVDESVDFTTQPAAFRVRGLLQLPPLKLLQGHTLPPLKFTAMYRPSTANSTASTMRY